MQTALKVSESRLSYPPSSWELTRRWRGLYDPNLHRDRPAVDHTTKRLGYNGWKRRPTLVNWMVERYAKLGFRWGHCMANSSGEVVTPPDLPHGRWPRLHRGRNRAGSRYLRRYPGDRWAPLRAPTSQFMRSTLPKRATLSPQLHHLQLAPRRPRLPKGGAQLIAQPLLALSSRYANELAYRAGMSKPGW